MLKIVTKSVDLWDEQKEEFVTIPAYSLELEHSLVALHKWEAKYKKLFFDTQKSKEELLYYIQCMIVSPKDVHPLTVYGIRESDFEAIGDYINDSMTATTFSNHDPRRSDAPPRRRTNFSAEYIYYLMFTFGIPLEWENRHINQLMTLIKIFQIKNNQNGKKMSKKDTLSSYAALNAARRAASGSKG